MHAAATQAIRDGAVPCRVLTRAIADAGANAFNETLFASQLPSRIAIVHDRLRLEQSLRTLMIVSADAAPTVPPAIAVAPTG